MKISSSSVMIPSAGLLSLCAGHGLRINEGAKREPQKNIPALLKKMVPDGMAEEEGFEPPRPFQFNGFQDRRFQPLTHSSVFNSSVLCELSANLLNSHTEMLHLPMPAAMHLLTRSPHQEEW